ncbi:MAG: outer rane immunogenic protein [Bradyrhizobium sp.]|nr:outer rane immunogenic protein [Bradyrhizobium sp.]
MRVAISASIAALIAGTVAASAADMPVKAAPYIAPPAPIYTWTGFYLGVNAGIGGDRVDYPFRGDFRERPFTGDVNLTSFGGFGGVQGGYNWQAGNWVLGVEADIEGTNIKSRLNASVSAPPFLNASLSTGTELKYFGTARGRIGYAFDRVLVYATGGYAFGSEDTRLDASLTTGGLIPIGTLRVIDGGNNTNTFHFSRRHDLSGWTAGGGVEYAVTPNLSLKTEYLYLRFDRNNVFASNHFAIDDQINLHTLKFGVNYKFGPWGANPVVAKY